MPSAAPRVSIGLLVYNGEAYLAKTLDSLLAQSFGGFELIVSDNASTDRTAAICRDYAARDPRIRYVRNDRNLGVAKNFNQTIAMSRGQYFKCAAHDDLYAPAFLERCVAALDADPGAVLSHCSARFIGPDGAALPFDSETQTYSDPRGRRLWPEQAFLAESDAPTARFREVLHAMRWCFAIFGVIRADALQRTSLHRSFYGADKTLLAELALLGPFRQIDEPLYIKRVHFDMSLYLDEHERRAHIAPDTGQSLTVLRRALAYIAAIRVAPLTWSERLQCLGSVLTKEPVALKRLHR